jgi:hypothetical protein
MMPVDSMRANMVTGPTKTYPSPPSALDSAADSAERTGMSEVVRGAGCGLA